MLNVTWPCCRFQYESAFLDNIRYALQSQDLGLHRVKQADELREGLSDLLEEFAEAMVEEDQQLEGARNICEEQQIGCECGDEVKEALA